MCLTLLQRVREWPTRLLPVDGGLAAGMVVADLGHDDHHDEHDQRPDGAGLAGRDDLHLEQLKFNFNVVWAQGDSGG